MRTYLFHCSGACMFPAYLSGMLIWLQLSLSDNNHSVADETQAQRMMMQAICKIILSARFTFTIPLFLNVIINTFQLSGKCSKKHMCISSVCCFLIICSLQCVSMTLIVTTDVLTIALWLFKNHKIRGSLRTSLQVREPANRSSVPYPAPTGMFLRTTVVLLTCHRTLRQTTCSQLHSMVYLGPGEVPELQMQEQLWRRSAPCWFRFQCHSFWLGLAQCSLGCCWKWFRWEKKGILMQIQRNETETDRMWWYQDQ